MYPDIHCNRVTHRPARYAYCLSACTSETDYSARGGALIKTRSRWAGKIAALLRKAVIDRALDQNDHRKHCFCSFSPQKHRQFATAVSDQLSRPDRKSLKFVTLTPVKCSLDKQARIQTGNLFEMTYEEVDAADKASLRITVRQCFVFFTFQQAPNI